MMDEVTERCHKKQEELQQLSTWWTWELCDSSCLTAFLRYFKLDEIGGRGSAVKIETVAECPEVN